MKAHEKPPSGSAPALAAVYCASVRAGCPPPLVSARRLLCVVTGNASPSAELLCVCSSNDTQFLNIQEHLPSGGALWWADGRWTWAGDNAAHPESYRSRSQCPEQGLTILVQLGPRASWRKRPGSCIFSVVVSVQSCLITLPADPPHYSQGGCHTYRHSLCPTGRAGPSFADFLCHRSGIRARLTQA